MPQPSDHAAPQLRSTARQYAPDTRMPAHADGRSRLSLVLAGQVLEQVGREDVIAGAGSLAIKPGHVVHRNQFGPAGAHLLSIDLPPGDGGGDGLLDRWRWFAHRPLWTLALRMVLAVRNGAPATRVTDLLAELQAAMLPLGSTAAAGTAPAWLARLRERLHDAPDGAGLGTLAADAGVHPVYLARQFRRHWHCSLTDYAQAARLGRAIERMAAGSDSLAAIAAACGYADQSHLCRAVRRDLALTPRRCRELLAATGARVPAAELQSSKTRPRRPATLA